MSRITITPLSSALGADISGVDLHRPIDADTLSEIRSAWSQHLVLRFRGQELSDPQLLALSRQFGDLDPPGPNPYGKPFLLDFPEINVISNVRIDGQPIGNLGDGEAAWHGDMTYVEAPPRAALLHALELPQDGGVRFPAAMAST